MPQDERELGNLLALLAQLEQGALARVLIKKVGDVLQRPAVVLGYRRLEGCLLGMALGEGANAVVGAGDAIVMLLLGDVGGSRGGLSMVLVRRLLVHPGRVGLGVLVVGVDVRV